MLRRIQLAEAFPAAVTIDRGCQSIEDADVNVNRDDARTEEERVSKKDRH